MDSPIKLFSNLHFLKPRTPTLKLQVSMLEKLSKLLDNGYTIIQALSVMQWDDKIADLCLSVTESLKDGLSIDEAFQVINFDDEVISYLYFARSSGELSSIIKNCADMVKKRMESMKKFKQTSRYPLFLFVMSTILLWFVKESVYPAFYDLFLSSGSISPFLTFSMLLIDILFLCLQILLILLFIAVPAFTFFKKRAVIELQLQVNRKIPIYRLYLKKRITFLFSLHLSSLFHAGFSPKEAFQTIAQQKKQPILSFYAASIMQELERGIPLNSILPSLYFLETELQSIFQKHATTSWLEKDLASYAEFLLEQLEEQIRKAASFIQPVVFCLLGCLIIFIYLSIMLPMFQLINSI